MATDATMGRAGAEAWGWAAASRASGGGGTSVARSELVVGLRRMMMVMIVMTMARAAASWWPRALLWSMWGHCINEWMSIFSKRQIQMHPLLFVMVVHKSSTQVQIILNRPPFCLPTAYLQSS